MQLHEGDRKPPTGSVELATARRYLPDSGPRDCLQPDGIRILDIQYARDTAEPRKGCERRPFIGDGVVTVEERGDSALLDEGQRNPSPLHPVHDIAPRLREYGNVAVENFTRIQKTRRDADRQQSRQGGGTQLSSFSSRSAISSSAAR